MKKLARVAPWFAALAACTQAPAGGGGSGGSTASGGAAVGTGGSGGSAGGASSGGAPGSGGATSSGGVTSSGGAGGGTRSGGAGGVTGSGGAAGSTTTACAPPTIMPMPATGNDAVAGTLTQFNDNGAWTWYSDERAVVDTLGGKLIISSDGNSMGAGGAARNGQVDAVIYDMAANTSQRTALGQLSPDDHNNAAILVRPDGKYVAMFAGHNQDCRSYYRTFDGTTWGTTATFDWVPLGCDLAVNTKVSYSNLWNMSAENKIYSFVRSIGTSPNLLVSTDNGQTFTYGGRLTSTPQVGYVAGYYKYWGNGVDRIDFVGTEAHPRDFDNSLYHGYVKAGRTYDSNDRMVDADISDSTQPDITAFTKLFVTGSIIHGVTLTHAWNIDLQRYSDGTIALLWKARADTNTDNPDHRLLYARYDGTSWKLTYLGKAGPKLYASEQDYVGLGALHPDDPHTIYISTTFDPRDDATVLAKHEIFQGTTCDNGATFTWTPITARSTRDNLRPIVPAWDANHTALLWFRGTYTTAQQYNAAVVGIISTKP
jgi:hypothetical protein